MKFQFFNLCQLIFRDKTIENKIIVLFYLTTMCQTYLSTNINLEFQHQSSSQSYIDKITAFFVYFRHDSTPDYASLLSGRNQLPQGGQHNSPFSMNNMTSASPYRDMNTHNILNQANAGQLSYITYHFWKPISTMTFPLSQ